MDQGNMDTWESVSLAAERGWKITLSFSTGEEYKGAYITYIDEEKQAFVVERVGERHLKPKIVFAKDLATAKVHW